MKKALQAILFDWDNTLVDSQQGMNDAINYTLNKMGHSNLLITRYSHTSRREYLIHLFGDRWEEANAIYQQYLDQVLVENLKLNFGVVEMLEKIKHYNLYLAIVSNKEANCLRQEVAYFGLSDYFRKIIGSGDTSEDKPSPLPILFALEGSKIEPNNQVLFVGDSITDVHCAKNANCLPIIYGQPIIGCNDLLSFQNFNKFTEFVLKMLEHDE